MGCGTCGNNRKDGEPAGCQSKGHCSTGGCNRLNTYNWLSDIPNFGERDTFNIVEVSFKNGSRKGFYRNYLNSVIYTGDTVVVETNYGQDVGKISLSGELVRLQMRKKRISEDSPKITRLMRLATEGDIDRAMNFRESEPYVLVQSRVIARDLGLNMKISDIEYQADGRKITFYYTADDRVDFRELIKIYAKEFKVRVEMCQIGPRQEAGKIGGIGSCGRELCCSTWLTSFKTVHTSIARYQNLAINQAKLSGQCGRLKCCLNYELDAYLDALKDFPKRVDFLETEQGSARLAKTDIFKRKMWYALPNSPLIMLSLERVREIKAMNERGEKPERLLDAAVREARRLLLEDQQDKSYMGKVEEIDLPSLKKNKKRKRRNRNNKNNKNKKRPAPPASQEVDPFMKKGDKSKAKSNTKSKPKPNTQKSKPNIQKPTSNNTKKQPPEKKPKKPDTKKPTTHSTEEKNSNTNKPTNNSRRNKNRGKNNPPKPNGSKKKE